MYKDSELLAKIKRKYKLQKGDAVTLELFETISRKENISQDNLKMLLEINSTKLNKLKKGKQVYTKLKFNMYEEISYKIIFEKGEINYEEFQKLGENLNIKPTRLRNSMGIYYSLYKKLRNGEVKNIRVYDMHLKHKVQLIRLDMEYFKKYKIGYYSCNKLTQMCEARNLTLDNFLQYYNKNPKCYELNKLIISNLNKIWIGQIKIPDNFISKHYDELYKRIEYKAYCTININNCIYIKKELIQDALDELYENCGSVVKNFYFNEQIVLNILAKKAKYIIMNMCKKERCESKNIYYDKFENPEHSLIIADNKYNPQKLFE